MSSAEQREQITRSLHEKDYRDAFVAAHIGTGLACQIRAMREARGWSQAELGQRVGMAQERISRLENPDYEQYSLATLKRLASAFDVALLVRFAPYAELVDWATRLTPEQLSVPPTATPRSEETAAPAMQHHPKSPHASPERLRALAGVIALKGPAPSTQCLAEAEPGLHNATAPRPED